MDTKEFNELFKQAVTDWNSLEKLYYFYYPKILNHIIIKFGSRYAEDIAQEFFKRLIDGKYSAQNQIQYPTAWIYRCCDNIAINAFKRESRFKMSLFTCLNCL